MSADGLLLEMHDLHWVVYVGFGLALFTAMGIGANDVANAFATSVGSGAITYKQAVVVAAIFEFSGAVFLGGGVTKTIRKGIADLSQFCTDPEELVVGMLAVILSTGLWLALATYYELPVSTTHSCVGGVIGIAVAAKGLGAVHWGYPGVLKIAASWVVSPVVSGLLAAAVFMFVRGSVLRQDAPLDKALALFPGLVWFTTFLNVAMILTHSHFFDFLSTALAFGVAFVVAVVVAIAVKFLYVDKLGETITRQHEQAEGSGEKDIADEPATESETDNPVGSAEVGADANEQKQDEKAEQEDQADKSTDLEAMRDRSENFDPQAEQVFTKIQVMTAMFMSLSHGSNDVANSIGPYAAVIAIYTVCTEFHSTDWCTRSFGPSTYDYSTDTCVCDDDYGFANVSTIPRFQYSFDAITGTTEHQYWDSPSRTCGAYDDDELTSDKSPPDAGAKCVLGLGQSDRRTAPVLCVSGNAPVPTWIFVLGGFGIVLGLVLFGRKILVAMGTKLTKITPSRGFVIQIVAAFVVTMGSFLELPLSTTHCQVGATIGVGLMEGTGAVNQQFVLKIFGGWVVTLAVTAVSSGVLYLIMIAVLNG